ncbi:MAG: chemotaxis protein CheX [Magnetococcales bacterium]|nr:chemotaxis protein CheX [Magnetococcales bacterium]
MIKDALEETAVAFFAVDIGLTPGPTIVKADDEPYEPPDADVTAVIGFTGSMEGGVHLSAPLHSALALASAFSGEDLTSFESTARDAVGELTNIIAGAVKSRISDDIRLTPPYVISGSRLIISYARSLSSAKCYFRTNKGPFFVEIFYKK